MSRTTNIAFFLPVIFLSTACTSTPAGDKTEIGASLTNKIVVAIAELPDGVMQAAWETRPDTNFNSAEKEIRRGITYFDVGGIDENGDEIELDIMESGEGWRVVEIQRDISLAKTPEPVLSALAAHAPDIVPARIIESDQNDGVIIYEFFTRDENGAETKYEVKYEDNKAEFLTEEWAH